MILTKIWYYILLKIFNLTYLINKTIQRVSIPTCHCNSAILYLPYKGSHSSVICTVHQKKNCLIGKRGLIHVGKGAGTFRMETLAIRSNGLMRSASMNKSFFPGSWRRHSILGYSQVTQAPSADSSSSHPFNRSTVSELEGH